MAPGAEQLRKVAGQLTDVAFFSHGCRLAGTLLLPASSADSAAFPCVVHPPGWLGLRSARLYRPYHEALLEAGIAVLTLDYRGFGESEGSARRVDPMQQVEDIRAAVSYAETRSEIDSRRIGVFGSGGTGGGNAVVAAGLDERLRAVVSQVPIADGRQWLRRMRSEHEWHAFLHRVAEDRRKQAESGVSEMVAPQEIVLPTPERLQTNVKSDVDTRVPREVELASADAILDYRPIDFVARIAPRAAMFICVEGDATTPEEHAHALFERAGNPKRLVVQTQTTHYSAYEQYGGRVARLIADWFSGHLQDGEVRVKDGADESSISVLRESDRELS